MALVVSAAACVLSFANDHAEAGPWTKKQGEHYLKVSESLYVSDAFIDSFGRVRRGVSHRSLTTALYGEVGLWDDLHLQFYAPYTRGRNESRRGHFAASGGGDLRLGLQAGSPLFDAPHAFRLELKVPLYDVRRPRGGDTQEFPRPGDGQVDTIAWISVGDSGEALGAYGFFELGYRYRTDHFVGGRLGDRSFLNTMVFSGQMGGTARGRLRAAVNLNGELAFGSDVFTSETLRLGASFALRIAEKVWLEGSYDRAMWVNNAAKGWAADVGISYQSS